MLRYGSYELKVIHIPGHTPGSIAAYIDMDNKRILFGQDVHGPYYAQWGGDPAQAKLSLQKLIELKADILCEGHFGIYQPAAAVERYIQGYIDSL
jgi:glyoxylase-like metal-dependent hydrolase (beta-lactamase superfamily II)